MVVPSFLLVAVSLLVGDDELQCDESPRDIKCGDYPWHLVIDPCSNIMKSSYVYNPYQFIFGIAGVAIGVIIVLFPITWGRFCIRKLNYQVKEEKKELERDSSSEEDEAGSDDEEMETVGKDGKPKYAGAKYGLTEEDEIHPEYVHLHEKIKDYNMEQTMDQLTNIKKIHTSSNGQISKAQWRGQDVVMKELTKTLPDDPTFGEEVKNILKLKHDNVLPFLGILLPPLPSPALAQWSASALDQDPPNPAYPVLIFPAAHRGSLYDLLHGIDAKPLEWSTKKQFMTDIVIAVGYLHQNNFFHGDIRSSHILVEKDFSLRIGGFASSIRLALRKGENKNDTSKAAQVRHEKFYTNRDPLIVNQPQWLSPEILKGNGKLTQKSDVYSLGILMWEILTMQLPFEGYSFKSLVEAVCEDDERPELPSPSEDVPKGILTLIQSCWKTDPEERCNLETLKTQLSRI
ncbi:putative serine/threonine protein kinase [Blattamonas nauphoetae]|uniref:Serine/threonine protein kinase n=1 Tax=Blattamonas nauphoetae TaxID=2049346 RepID=A0ABQ9XEC3_9EUKA|nr:putative serine/threonine protein kinase [Blattamonas nauphoetae]